MIFEKALLFFVRKKTLGKPAYCVYFAALILSTSVLFSYLFYSVGGRANESSTGRLFAQIVASPVFETIGFQLSPFLVARKFKLRAEWKFALMSIPFAVAHYRFGEAAVLNAMVAGSILSMVFLARSEESTADAVQTTAAIHILHNFFAGILSAFGMGN